MRRRRYLALLGTATVSSLAGCSGENGGGDSTTTDAGSEPTTGTETPTEATGTETTDSEPTTATAAETETPTATRTETETSTPTRSTTETTTGEPSSGTTSEGTSENSGEVQTVDVGPGGRYLFEPGTQSPLEIPVGTTVEWVWQSDTHNIAVDSQPSGSTWEGTPGGAGSVYNSGYTHTHTFETEGEYHYWCTPHRSLGMEADIVVTNGQ
jgi:plastocyanin